MREVCSDVSTLGSSNSNCPLHLRELNTLLRRQDIQVTVGSSAPTNTNTPRTGSAQHLQTKQDMRKGTGKEPMAVTSSLNSIHISPRTPKTPRATMGTGDEDDVELELLNEEERIQSARDFGYTGNGASAVEHEDISKRPISPKDKRNMVLLCVLCMSISLNPRMRQVTYFGLRFVTGHSSTCHLSHRAGDTLMVNYIS